MTLLDRTPTPAPLSQQSAAVDALLAAYAAGSLPMASHALVAAHLEIRPENRAFVRALESSLARRIEGAPEAAPVAGRDSRLAAIFASGEIRGTTSPSCPVLPRALQRFARGTAEDLPWKRLLPGVRESRLPEIGEHATFYWIEAGRTLPSHTHEGAEITLVLKGAFGDQNGRYGRGDIAIADESVDHHPSSEVQEDCICFAVSEGRLQLTSWWGRLINPFLPH